MRERRAVETEEQRKARLQRKNSEQSERFSAETEELREGRLISISDTQRERLESVSQNEWQNRLDASQRDTFAREFQDECEDRIE